MEFISSPNYSPGRMNVPINRIVMHWFGAGTIDSAIASFQSPLRQASAHYLVSDNRVVQMVREADTAWHSGNAEMNRRSIGIETDANPTKALSESSYKTVGKLVGQICLRYNLPISRETIIPHRDVKPTQCPGTVDLDKIIAIAKEGGTMDDEQVIRLLAKVAHHAWRITHKYQFPNDASIESDVRSKFADYKQGNDWAFSPLLDKWYEEGIKPQLGLPLTEEQKKQITKDFISKL